MTASNELGVVYATVWIGSVLFNPKIPIFSCQAGPKRTAAHRPLLSVPPKPTISQSSCHRSSLRIGWWSTSGVAHPAPPRFPMPREANAAGPWRFQVWGEAAGGEEASCWCCCSGFVRLDGAMCFGEARVVQHGGHKFSTPKG